MGETREHLEAMMAARRADGLDASAAWHDVRRCFGDADTIGRELAREWERAPRHETEGTPLSNREKVLIVVGSLASGLLFFLILTAVSPWLAARHLQGLFSLVAIPLLWLFMGWQLRKKQGPFTPTKIFALLYGFAVIMAFPLRYQFAGALRGTHWETLLNAPRSPHFDFVVMVVCLFLALGRKRENKKVLPWRRWGRYSSNPIGTEDEYHFNISFGRILGTAIPCVSALLSALLVGSVSSMVPSLAICLGVVAMNVAIGRWLR